MKFENNHLLLLLVVLVSLALLYRQSMKEGYDSVTKRLNESRNIMEDYYLWRAYGHDVYDYNRLTRYPYNQKPLSHPKRYTHYNPAFYQYGYGHL